MAAEFFTDTRTGQNTWHVPVAQLRQWVCSRLAVWEDTNDAEQLCKEPVMRCLVGGRTKEHKAASTRQMGRLEIDVLHTVGEPTGTHGLLGAWIDRVSRRKPMNILILDLDFSVSPIHDHHEGVAYNGHFECTY